MENLIPFEVEVLPLPEGVEFFGSEGESKRVESRVLGKVYTVVSIKPNPPYRFKFFSGIAVLAESCFAKKVFDDLTFGVSHQEHLACDLFLLFRGGEVPVWWPSICCMAIHSA